MDSVLKLVYSYLNHRDKDNQFILNGVHPAIVNKFSDQLNSLIGYQQCIKNLAEVNKNDNWNCFNRHANFYGYASRFLNPNSFVSVDDIKDDGNLYLFPIEICGILDDIYEPVTVELNGETVNFTFIDTLPNQIIELLKVGKVKLVLNIIHDPLNNVGKIFQIEQYFLKYNIDTTNIILLGGNRLDDYYKIHPDSKLKMTNGYLMLQQAGERLFQFPFVSSLGYLSDAVKENDLNSKIFRNKKFLCWNRTMRDHRYWLAYSALRNNLLEGNYFTFLNPLGKTKENVFHILYSLIEDSHESAIYADKICKLIPYELDTQNLTVHGKTSFPVNNNKKEFYLDSYIHITSETVFDNLPLSTPFYSEKTFHPIINLQPFVYIGSHLGIKQLRDWGFKTFHPYIDESYDSEISAVKRFKMIELEILKLQSKSIGEIHDWYYSILDTLIYNQEHLKSFAAINPFEEVFTQIKNFYTEI